MSAVDWLHVIDAYWGHGRVGVGNLWLNTLRRNRADALENLRCKAYLRARAGR